MGRRIARYHHARQVSPPRSVTDMTAKQFCSGLEKLGLSQVGAAKLLGITDRTSRRYAAGDAEIPEPTAKLLRLAIAGKISVADIENS